MLRILISIVFIISIYNISIAQDLTPKYSNEFLSLGVGSRAFSMGNAVVASHKGTEASYWNPAGIRVENYDNQIAAMHNEYFGGMAKYDYAGISTNIDDEFSLAINILRFGVDNIPNSLELVDDDGNIRFDRLSSFSSVDYACYFSGSKKTKIEGLTIGASAKLIYRYAGDFAKAYGFGFDFGIQYQSNKFKYGLVLRDAFSTFNTWIYDNKQLVKVYELTNNEIPENATELTLPSFILGVGRDFNISKKINLFLEFDLKSTFDGKRNVMIKSDPISIDPSFGLELSYMDIVKLRAGLSNYQKEKDFDNKSAVTVQPNLGVGLKFKGFILDYAITDIGDVSISKYSNVFSLSYLF
ncbi:MAG: hypothetical protein N4A49_16530 [Marinifilaceae bacterium]|jgi:hypothetical protein|nr:hypothetical protein [Marinifilaceae bacterium]